MNDRIRYGTWIRTRRIVIFWAISAVSIGVAALSPLTPWLLFALAPALLFAYIASIVTLTAWRFSPKGGDYQNRIHELILSFKTEPGDTLDIGCGAGNLIIKAAKGDRTSKHVGLDYWGDAWEYSVEQCRTNARLEGVENVAFVRASASSTGLPDAEFDAVVSCLTFHEVRDEPDKKLVVREALRVLKPGGRFVFMDLFDDTRFYPPHAELVRAIGEAGCELESDTPLGEVLPLHYPLNDARALRFARILAGTKRAAI